MIDSVIDILDETINEFETLSKSVSESSGGGEKLTAGGLSGVKATGTKIGNAGTELQPPAETESGLESSTVSERPEGLDTRGYKESGVNAKAFQKADEDEAEEKKEKEEKEETKKSDEDEREKKRKELFAKFKKADDEDEKNRFEKFEKAEMEKADHEKEETEEEEVEEKAKKKMKKCDEEDKKEEVEKSVKMDDSLKKSFEEMQEQIKSLSQAVKDLSEMPVPAKGVMFNNMKPLKKSDESEVLSKSEIVNKLFELQKSGKDISTEEIVKAELGSDESANAIAKKYL